MADEPKVPPALEDRPAAQEADNKVGSLTVPHPFRKSVGEFMAHLRDELATELHLANKNSPASKRSSATRIDRNGLPIIPKDKGPSRIS